MASAPSMRARLRAGACVATILAGPGGAWAEVQSFSLAAKGTFDAGTPFVTGVATGLGAGAAMRLTFGAEDRRWEVALDADIAGFQGEGDGDPILQLAASVARRGYFGGDDASRAYWFAGAGGGVLGIAGGRAALPLRAGLGMSVGGDTGIDVSVFNRFTVLFGSGDPSVDFINSVGLELALRFGR
jgi:hypothetical protein